MSALYAVSALAYVFWVFGEYAVGYLSRVREYAADRFGAEYTHPDALPSTLRKIAHGIVVSEDDPELSKPTRNIGIMNVRASKNDGMTYHNAQESGEPDLTFRGDTGLMYLKHESWLPLLGNLLLSVRDVPELIGERVDTRAGISAATARGRACTDSPLATSASRATSTTAASSAAVS